VDYFADGYYDTMSTTVDIDGPLYVEVNKVWEEVYAVIAGTKFQAYKRIRDDVPASKSNRSEMVVMQVRTIHIACSWSFWCNCALSVV
jgi:hypothetical protein